MPERSFLMVGNAYAKMRRDLKVQNYPNPTSLIFDLAQINIHKPNEKFGGANSKPNTFNLALSPYEF